MKKIFAKELAALAVLALAFTGCNTAFEGTNANFAEKEAQYTDRSGVTQSVNNPGSVTCTDSINNTNKKNEVVVTITSFSKINVSSADEAIHFQHLTNNTKNAAYYPIRGADLPKTRTKVYERANTTSITYEVDGTGVTANQVALFVDATKLKTKGGTPVLAGDGNLKRGEVSDSIVIYLGANGTTVLTYNTLYKEDFAPFYNPLTTPTTAFYNLADASGKSLGKTRFVVGARNKAKPGETAAYEDGLVAKLNDSIVMQYREPGSRTYTEKKLSWTYHSADSTAMGTDPYVANTYTADVGPLAVGTVGRLIQTKFDGFTAPAWYIDVYGHEASYYYGNRAGAKSEFSAYSTFTYHAEVPSYIVVNASDATTGTDHTSTYAPYRSFTKDNIRGAQNTFFAVSYEDNWIKVEPSSSAVRDILDPATTKDFIVVDANNKKIAADVEVVTYSYNDSTTLSGKINYVKITLKDVRYRNYKSSTGSTPTNPGALKVLVGEGTKIKENKYYPNQKSFGQWKDVADDDASGYVQIN